MPALTDAEDFPDNDSLVGSGQPIKVQTAFPVAVLSYFAEGKPRPFSAISAGKDGARTGPDDEPSLVRRLITAAVLFRGAMQGRCPARSHGKVRQLGEVRRHP